MSSSLQLQMLH